MGDAGRPSELVFGLSRAMGHTWSNDVAREFAAVLDELGFATVAPFDTYEELVEALLNGDVHAAWAPPLVCARVEALGGQVVLRSVRAGAASYRSALIRRTDWGFTLETLGELNSLRAVWVGKHSMGGYVLPRHLLRAAGIDLDAVFAEQKLLGSYEACFEEVWLGTAHVTASYCSPASVAQPKRGYETILGGRAHAIEVIGHSEAVPNDGVALSPRLADDAEAVTRALVERAVAGGPSGAFARMFDADALEPVAAGVYRVLLDFL